MRVTLKPVEKEDIETMQYKSHEVEYVRNI